MSSAKQIISKRRLRCSTLVDRSSLDNRNTSTTSDLVFKSNNFNNYTNQSNTKILRYSSFQSFSLFFLALILLNSFHVSFVNAIDFNNLIKSYNYQRALVNPEASTCSNIEPDVTYLNYILNYKDNVNSTNDCCDFCNANIRCIIWSLDLDINRCWLKYDRGARVISNGISSGFSASYYASLMKPSTTTVPSTTTSVPSTTTPVTTTTITQKSKCEVIEGIMLYGYLATMPFYVNAEASCCDLCNQTSGLCQSYTYFPNNRTCLLFKANIVGFRNCSNEEPCFSGRLPAERTTPIQFTTTPIVPTRKSSYRLPPFSYNQLSNVTVNKDLTCYYESGVSYFSLTPIDEISNTNLSTCCELCHKNLQCLSWTFTTSTDGRCTHFDTIRPNPAYIRGFTSGFSDKTTAFAFHSLFDQFQMKFYNLNPNYNYSYINSRPFYTTEQQAYLKQTISYLESKIRTLIEPYLRNAVFRIVIDNLNYVAQKNSILTSFLVVLDPRMQDFNQANNLLNTFNLLVNNKAIFNNLQYYNESESRSSLLPNVSNFSLGSITLSELSGLSFLNFVVTLPPVTTPLPTTTTIKTTTISSTPTIISASTLSANTTILAGTEASTTLTVMNSTVNSTNSNSTETSASSSLDATSLATSSTVSPSSANTSSSSSSQINSTNTTADISSLSSTNFKTSVLDTNNSTQETQSASSSSNAEGSTQGVMSSVAPDTISAKTSQEVNSTIEQTSSTEAETSSNFAPITMTMTVALKNTTESIQTQSSNGPQSSTKSTSTTVSSVTEASSSSRSSSSYTTSEAISTADSVASSNTFSSTNIALTTTSSIKSGGSISLDHVSQFETSRDGASSTHGNDIATSVSEGTTTKQNSFSRESGASEAVKTTSSETASPTDSDINISVQPLNTTNEDKSTPMISLELPVTTARRNFTSNDVLNTVVDATKPTLLTSLDRLSNTYADSFSGPTSAELETGPRTSTNKIDFQSSAYLTTDSISVTGRLITTSVLNETTRNDSSSTISKTSMKTAESSSQTLIASSASPVVSPSSTKAPILGSTTTNNPPSSRVSPTFTISLSNFTTTVINLPTTSDNSFSSLVDLNSELSEYDRCYIEKNTFYLGPDLQMFDQPMTLTECCHACSLNSECQSWVFNLLNSTCVLKKTFRHGYYLITGYISGFTHPKFDSYITVSKSLGIQRFNFSEFFLNPAAQVDSNSNQKVTNFTIRTEVVGIFRNQLLYAWRRLMHSNVADIELTEIFLTSLQSYANNTFKDDTTLVISYLIKLDPRITRNLQIINKLMNIVSSTLKSDNFNIYNNLTKTVPQYFQNDTYAFVLSTAQISFLQIPSKLVADSSTTIEKSNTTRHLQAELSTTTLAPLTTNFVVEIYQQSYCYVEVNVNYVSANDSDTFAFFSSRAKEDCCSTCNKIPACQSWTFDAVNYTCALKYSFRSNPTSMNNYYSGFKANGLFALIISKGLEFKNLKNPAYEFLNKTPSECNELEKQLYASMVVDLSAQLSKIIKCTLNNSLVTNVFVYSINYNFDDKSMTLDYEVDLDPRYTNNIQFIQDQMNALFADPSNVQNPLLSVKPPYVNNDNTPIITLVPITTSGFYFLASNTSPFPTSTSTTPTTTKQSTTTATHVSSIYLGCFIDSRDNNRDLNYSGLSPVLDSSSMTPDTCITTCSNLGQPYAGLQFGRECYCGQSYGKYGQVDMGECFLPCTGDRTVKCGGYSRNDVYAVGVQEPSSTFSTSSTSSTTSGGGGGVTTQGQSTTSQMSTSSTTSTTTSKPASTVSTSSGQTTTSGSAGTTTTSTTTRTSSSATSVSTGTATASTISTTLTSTLTSTLSSSSPTTSTTHSTSVNPNTSSSTSTLNPLTSTSLTTVTTIITTRNITSATSSTGFSTQSTTTTSLTTLSTTQLTSSSNGLSTTSGNGNPTSSTAPPTNLSSLTTTSTSLMTTSFTSTTNFNSITTISTTTLQTSTASTASSSTTSSNDLSTLTTIENSNLTAQTTTTRQTTVSSASTTTSGSQTTATSSARSTSVATSAVTTGTSTTTSAAQITTTNPNQGGSTTSTSTGQTSTVLSSKPSAIVDPNAYLITIVQVPTAVNLADQQFTNNMTNGLRTAFANAFQKSYKVFTNKNALYQTAPPTVDQIQLVMSSINNTGLTNEDNTKNLVSLRYYLVNTVNNEIIQSDYAADAINLLSKQELAQTLGQSVDEKGYVETRPRAPINYDQRLWIIGAVLGPLALIIVLLWIIAFVYYKCINPKRTKLQKMVPRNPPYSNSSTSSQENILKSKSKVQPSINQSKEKLIDPKDGHDQILRAFEAPVTQSASSAGQSSTIKKLITASGGSLSSSVAPLAPSNKRSVKTTHLSDHFEEAAYMNRKLNEDFEATQRSRDIDSSIRQRNEIEKWRNKQRQRERDQDFDQRPSGIELVDRKVVSKRIAPIPVSKDSYSNTSIKNESTNTDDLIYPLPTISATADRQGRDDLMIVTNNDIYSHVSSQHTPVTNQIISEHSRPSKNYLHSSQKPMAPYVPVKVHVTHKPTDEDVGRVYNPYSVQNEYEKYVKNGFLFEPLHVNNSSNLLAMAEQSSPPVYLGSRPNSNGSVSIANKHQQQLSPSTNPLHSNANISFTSETISPYTRKSNIIHYKNAVSNDQLLNYARGHANPSFQNQNDEFGSDPYGESKNNEGVPHHVKRTTTTTTVTTTKKHADGDGEGAMSSYQTNVYETLSSKSSIKKSTAKLIKADDDDDIAYQDEYEVANKISKRNNPGTNLELINSINKELKRLKTGYQPDASQA